MVYTKITEGFGNQLFKYACAYAVAQQKHDEIELDLTWYPLHRYRTFLLDQLNISGKVGAFPPYSSNTRTDLLISRIRKFLYVNKTGHCKIVSESHETEMHFHSYDFSYRRNILLFGYWQNSRYFSAYRDRLIMEFQPRQGVIGDRAKKMMQECRQENSVAVHIRKGDYPDKWRVDDSYYVQAVSMIDARITDPHYYIFCEDHEYADAFASGIRNATVVSSAGLSDLEEFFIMSSCKNKIIANSTYSWWAAYLDTSGDGIVIAPDYKQWTGDFYLDEWIKIKV